MKPIRIQDQKVYFNLCNPEEPLQPESARNVDIDNLSPGQPVRGLNWAERLAKYIEFSALLDPAAEKPACVLFTGLPGSGKSTELLRLRTRLEQRHGANLLAVLIQAENVLDLTDTIDVSDIYVSILYEVERRVLLAEGKDSSTAMKDGIWSRVANLLDGDVTIEAKATMAVLGASLALEMKENPDVRREVRRRVERSTSRFLRLCRAELKNLRDRALQAGYAGIVVIYDSLEKLRGITTNFAEVLRSAELLFAGDAQHLQLPIHTLYTVPPALILRLRTPVEFMPMVKLWNRDGSRFQPGYEVARQIVSQRIPNGEVLQAIFGTDDSHTLEQRIGRIIDWSAGYPRELVRLLRIAVLEAPLDDHKLDRLLGQAGDEYRRLLLGTDFEWLARVRIEHTPSPADETQRQAADRMFGSNVVLRYQNTTEWYEVHPAVRELPALLAAMQRLQASQNLPSPANSANPASPASSGLPKQP
jgi:hypothetical protein